MHDTVVGYPAQAMASEYDSEWAVAAEGKIRKQKNRKTRIYSESPVTDSD